MFSLNQQSIRIKEKTIFFMFPMLSEFMSVCMYVCVCVCVLCSVVAFLVYRNFLQTMQQPSNDL